MNYSEQELADKAQFLEFIGLTDEQRTKLNIDFSNPELHSSSLSFSVKPPVRCSDGVRRRFMEYMDFLFADVPFEDRIDQENTTNNKYITSATFDSGGNYIDILIRSRLC